MLALVEPDGRVSWLNNVALEYLGMRPEDVGRDRFREEVIHPEDFHAVEPQREEAFRTSSPFDAEERLRDRQGRYRWFLVRFRPLGGSLRGRWLVSATDIEDRRRAEDIAWRSATYLGAGQRLTQMGSWAWDVLSDRMVYWSDELYRIYGFDPREGLPTTSKALERVHPEDRERVRGATVAGEPEVEYRLLMPDGSVKHLRSLRQRVTNDTGSLIEVIGTVVDFTERKRAEEEHERLRQLELELERVNRISTLGALTASIAHEIRQPMTAATANARAVIRWLMRDEPVLSEAREASERMLSDVQRANEIITRVSAMFRKERPRRLLVDANEVARETLRLLGSEARRHSVTMHDALGSGLPVVAADRVQLQQVFLNLVLNAIEATPADGGEVTVESARDGEGAVLFSVTDTGTGLPGGAAGAIFDAFYTTKPQGTGMGLSICRNIVEAHGGRLWAENAPGRGATFRFTLPVSAGEGW